MKTPVQTSSPLVRPRPVLLAYPRVYANLSAPDWRFAFQNIVQKCYELMENRPEPKDRINGYFGLGMGDRQRLALYTVWGIKPTEPDIFIMSGSGDGFGPGDTCPTNDELRQGNYGSLKIVPFL